MGRVGLIPVWGDRERAFEVTEQLAYSLADPHTTLGRMPAGADHQDVSMLTSDHAVKRPGHGQIGLNRQPRVGRTRLDLGQHRPRLLVEALPVKSRR